MDYVAPENQDAAFKLGSEIIEHADILETFPYIGLTYPRRGAAKYREIVYGNFRIFYRVYEETKAVEIYSVWHGAQQTPDLP